jgi:hypothetical protein
MEGMQNADAKSCQLLSAKASHMRLRCPHHYWPGRKGSGPEDLSTNLIVQLGLVTEDIRSPIRLLLTWLPLDSLADPDSGPTTVLFDELDPGSLKSRLYLVSGVGPAA